MSAASATMGAKGEKNEKELLEPPKKKLRMMVDAFVAANLEKCEGLAQLYGHAANKMLQNMEKRKLQKGDGENSAKSSASSAGTLMRDRKSTRLNSSHT